MFTFFLMSNRKGILTFCGSHVDVRYDPTGVDAKECFRRYDNGYYKHKPVMTRHPNVVRSVITGKKSWGLWVKEWSMGISECTFWKEDFIEDFNKLGITLPQSLDKEFDNRIMFYKRKKWNNE